MAIAALVGAVGVSGGVVLAASGRAVPTAHRLGSAARPVVGIVDRRRPLVSRPVDWGQLRLSLPPGWALTAGPMFDVRCWEQPARSIYFSTRPLPPCRPSGPVPTVAVQPLRGAVPASWVRTGLGRLTAWRPPSRLADGRVRDVPALGVEITMRGAVSAVTRTARQSALHAIVTARLPVPVPSGWRPVSFDGFVADVPPAWPVVRIDERNVLQEVPICGGVMRAKVALGGVSVVIDCPAISAQSMLSATTPGSGLWLGGTTSVSQWVALTQAEAFRTVTLRSGAVTVVVGTQDVGGSGDVEGIVPAGGRALTFELGTGVDPLMAEEVLSSLRPAGAR